MNLDGKAVLVTGGAGGLGADTCLVLMAAGARVAALDVDERKIASLEERAVASGTADRLEVARLDLADLAGLRSGLEAVIERVGGLDVVVNMAAIYPSKPLDAYTSDEFAAVQRVNVEAAVVCLQAALPGMRAKGWGRVINIASVTFYGGWANLAPYVASKGALIGLTRAWARELGGDGITVNCIAPGAFPTDAEKIHPDLPGYERFVLEHQAVKRRGRPEDIARAILYFASEESGFLTGQTLNVDGGWVMH